MTIITKINDRNSAMIKKYLHIFIIFEILSNTLIYASFIDLRELDSYNSSNIFQANTDYGECSSSMCGQEICAIDNRGKCDIASGDAPSQQGDIIYQCTCKDGFITFEDNSMYKCCYEQKSALTALILEFFIGFGIGHFYVGNNFLGSIKCAIYSLLCSSSLAIVIHILKMRDKNERSFFFRVTCTICLLLCSCTYIAWQVVDAILFSIGGYGDGNGAALYNSQ